MLKRSKSAGFSTPAADLYRAIMARARDEVFYREWQVPDSIDGRFDLIALHAFLVFDALKQKGPVAAELGSRLADSIFVGFDEAFRELGVSDFGMGRRMRRIADAFYGRMAAYGASETNADMAGALLRNLYRGNEARRREAGAIATYMMNARVQLGQGVAALLAGKPDFGPLPHDGN